MVFVDAIMVSLATIALLLTVINAMTIRTPRLGAPHEESQISILIPMRNEARNVAEVMDSIALSLGNREYELIALDDQSTDETGSLLEAAKSKLPHLKVISGSEPDRGWLGKPAALEKLFRAASGDYLVFMDADVRLEPNAIPSTISLMKQKGWDFTSPYPRQVANTFLERVVQPLLQWSWFASVPLRVAERYRIPSMAVANGQLFIVRRDALQAIDGFSRVKSEILEDIEIARHLWRAGKRGIVTDGSAVAECRMYASSSELIDGYSKSLWRAFGSPLGATIISAILFATSVLPLVAGLMGDPWGWFAYFTVSLSRLIAALRTRSFWQSFLLHPLSVTILIYILLRSYLLKSQGRLLWRDRNISL